MNLTLEDLERFWEEAKKDFPDLLPSDIRQLIKALEKSQKALKEIVAEVAIMSLFDSFGAIVGDCMSKEKEAEVTKTTKILKNAKSAILPKRNE